MQVDPVQAVNPRPGGFVLAHAGEHIFVERRISEAEFLLVILAAEAVGRRLVDEIIGKTEDIADLPHFVHEQVGQGAEIARRVAVLGRIADVVLGGVAGIDDSGAPRRCMC